MIHEPTSGGGEPPKADPSRVAALVAACAEIMLADLGGTFATRDHAAAEESLRRSWVRAIERLGMHDKARSLDPADLPNLIEARRIVDRMANVALEEVVRQRFMHIPLTRKPGTP